MMTSSNGKLSALLALCVGNSLVTGEFPSQRPVAGSFDVFFDLRLNKRLGEQSWGWRFETPSRSLWRHYNVLQVRCASPHKHSVWPLRYMYSFCFPSQLELADISPLLKKDDPLSNENCRSVVLLIAVSKVFESRLCDQLSAFLF